MVIACYGYEKPCSSLQWLSKQTQCTATAVFYFGLEVFFHIHPSMLYRSCRFDVGESEALSDICKYNIVIIERL